MTSTALSAQPVASPHAHGGNSVTRTMGIALTAPDLIRAMLGPV